MISTRFVSSLRRRQPARHSRFDEIRRRRILQHDLAAIEAEIETLDAEIDARVYELYGLTEDEIKVVEMPRR
ncbi:MAG TPA: hypothetical protein VIK53_19240 [Verrucomicrobiae bacterium]